MQTAEPPVDLDAVRETSELTEVDERDELGEDVLGVAGAPVDGVVKDEGSSSRMVEFASPGTLDTTPEPGDGNEAKPLVGSGGAVEADAEGEAQAEDVGLEVAESTEVAPADAPRVLELMEAHARR